MSTKNNTSENTASDEADRVAKTRLSNTDDRNQVKMDFGKESVEDDDDELEFKRAMEAALEERAEEGRQLMEASRTEALNKEEQEQKDEGEALAQKIAEDEQRLQQEAEIKNREALEIKLEEENKARRRAEEELQLRQKEEAGDLPEIELNEEEQAEKNIAEQRRRIEETEARIRAEQQLKEKQKAVVERKDKKTNRTITREEIIKIREEEWRKFKVEADNKGNSEVEVPLRPASEPHESSEEIPSARNPNLKRMGIIVGLIIALVIFGIWIFSASDEAAKDEVPASPITNSTDLSPAATTTKPETDAADLEVSFSSLNIGDDYGEGIIFELDPSNNTGKIAFSKNLGPMPWNNAMDINTELGEGWRLPTMAELGEMYRSIGQGGTNNGAFSDALYWSATAYDKNQARLFRFTDGDTSFHYNNSLSTRKFLVRPVRDFEK